MQFKYRVNFQIKAQQVRVINNDGENLGIFQFKDAMQLATDQNLDLVEINSKSNPIIVKIIDYGKFKYEEKKKQSEIHKNQKIQELKEIMFRPNTDENDLLHKLNSAKEFIADGHKVKFTVKFKGREITHPQIGREKIDWIISQLDNTILANPLISMEGKIMYTIVTPVRK